MARRLRACPSIGGTGEIEVHERVLENGFRALVLPRGRIPIVVCDLFYSVGSFDEPPGKTGLAHFLEHMLFKGTTRFPKGQIDQLAFIAGGQANAETGEDETHYWFSLPSANWELPLEIEADRMLEARFDRSEVEAERKVIVEERAREQESPQARLEQTHRWISYVRHPYRNPVLGWPEDLRGIKVSDLSAFYKAHYRPDRAVLVLAGDLNPEQALERIESWFGPISREGRGGKSEPCEEPPQVGRREFLLHEANGLPRGLWGWHTVPRGHRDAPALDVVAELLGSGRKSRLWQTLVEHRKVATWVEAAHAPAVRAGQFFIHVECVPGSDPAVLERLVAEVLEEFSGEGPTPEELARTRNRLEVGWRWEQEDLAGVAAGIGQAALVGRWSDWQAEHLAAMSVEEAAIRRVARRYLHDAGLTIGWSMPRRRSLHPALRTPPPSPSRFRQTSQPEGSDKLAGPGQSSVQTSPRPTSAASVPRPLRSSDGVFPSVLGGCRLADYRPRRNCLENGLVVIHERRPGTEVVALELYVDAGCLREAKPGVAYLTGRLLEEGTSRRSADEFAAAIEDGGGVIEASSEGLSCRIRREDLALAIELLAEVVRQPRFATDDVEWMKQRIAAELKGDMEDPTFHAELAFRELIYGPHPLGRDPRGTPGQLRLIDHGDVVAHHRACYTPDHAFLVAVGDLEPRRLRSLVRRHFETWPRSGRPIPPRPPLLGPFRPRTRRIHHPGEQVHILMGHLGVSRLDPDFDALVVLDHILGTGPGFSDRLGRVVRDELGLVYSIGGGMTGTADLLPGLFRIYAGTMPDEAHQVVAAVAEQVRAMHHGAFSDDEVERARQYLAGAFVFDFQTVEQRAERLAELQRMGLDLDEPMTWPDRLARITPHQVRRAARDHLDPDALARVEYGPLRRRAGERSCG